jgi:hypothetical protein
MIAAEGRVVIGGPNPAALDVHGAVLDHVDRRAPPPDEKPPPDDLTHSEPSSTAPRSSTG